MRLLLTAPLLVLFACAAEPGEQAVPVAPTAHLAADAPPVAPADSFDARAWLAEARTALDTEDYDTLYARSRRLAAPLDAAVAWRRGCDTYADYETGALVYDPGDPASDEGAGRGLVELTPLGDDEAAVAVLCYRGAYQGSWALVHIQGDRAALVRAPEIGEDGQPTATVLATFGLPEFEEGRRVFATFVKSRGLGDCGTFTRYRLGEGGTAEVLDVRARDCEAEIPDELPPPDEWPLVYPR